MPEVGKGSLYVRADAQIQQVSAAAVNTAEGDNSSEHIADYFIQDGIPGWMRSEAEATLQSVYQAGDFTEKCPSFFRTSKGDLREHGDQCNNI